MLDRNQRFAVVGIVALLALSASEALAERPEGLPPDLRESVLRQRVCGTESPNLETMLELERQFKSRSFFAEPTLSDTNPLTIFVNFHIIQSTTGEGNVSESVLNAQIARMNAAYSSYNVRFVRGRVTDRVTNNTWFRMFHNSADEINAKNYFTSNADNDSRYVLNFYTARPRSSQGDLLGFATFPWDLAGAPRRDGVVIDFRSLPGGSLSGFNEGDTGVHEVGHWVGLYHTFQNFCSFPGDMVDDTPYHVTNSGCSFADSCPALPGSDPIHNYMNYTTDPCMTQFTAGQKTRAQSQINTYRPGLRQACPEASCSPVTNIPWYSQYDGPNCTGNEYTYARAEENNGMYHSWDGKGNVGHTVYWFYPSSHKSYRGDCQNIPAEGVIVPWVRVYRPGT